MWVRCPDVGALLRDYARVAASGEDPGHLVTASGERVDALELERADLSGSLKGEVSVVCLRSGPLAALGKLIELGARRAYFGGGELRADLTGVHVEVLTREGLVPAVWKSTLVQRSDQGSPSRLAKH